MLTFLFTSNRLLHQFFGCRQELHTFLVFLELQVVVQLKQSEPLQILVMQIWNNLASNYLVLSVQLRQVLLAAFSVCLEVKVASFSATASVETTVLLYPTGFFLATAVAFVVNTVLLYFTRALKVAYLVLVTVDKIKTKVL